MSGNGFTGILSPYIGALQSLKAISLSQNKLNGTLQLHTKGKNLLWNLAYLYFVSVVTYIYLKLIRSVRTSEEEWLI